MKYKVILTLWLSTQRGGIRINQCSEHTAETRLCPSLLPMYN